MRVRDDWCASTLRFLFGVVFCVAVTWSAGAEPLYFSAFNGTAGAGAIYVVHEDKSVTPFAGGLNHPAGLAFDAGGGLFVATNGDGRVWRFAPGSVVPTVFATGLSMPNGMTFDRASGNLLVANSGDGTIRQITPAGGISTLASGLGFGLRDVAVGPGGEIYAATSGKILRVNPPGGGPATTLTTKAVMPFGITVDVGGTVFYSDFANSVIQKLAADGSVTRFAGAGLTSGLAFAPDGGDLYSVNSGAIWAYAPDGTGRAATAGPLNYAIEYLAFPTVPEPASAGVLVTAMGTLALRRRRRPFSVSRP